MANQIGRYSDEQRVSRLHEAEGAQAKEQQDGQASSPAYLTSLLGKASLYGRGNGHLRSATMLHAQQTYGNRAVQRALQPSSAIDLQRGFAGSAHVSSPARVSIQRMMRPPDYLQQSEGFVLPAPLGTSSFEDNFSQGVNEAFGLPGKLGPLYAGLPEAMGGNSGGVLDEDAGDELGGPFADMLDAGSNLSGPLGGLLGDGFGSEGSPFFDQESGDVW